MTEKTERLIRETRKALRSMEDGTTDASVFAGCLVAGGISGAAFGSLFGCAAGFCYGIGTFGALVFWIWIFIFSRRAWLLSRAAFDVVSVDVEDLPETEPTKPEPPTPDPEPEPQPAVPDPSPMEQITSDARLMQLLMDMPTEKLQAIIDARSIRQ